MKYFFLALIILVLAVAIARADVYVVTAPDKSVYSISELPDAVVPPGYTVDIIKDKGISDLTIGDVKLYKYNAKKFTLDSAKVAAKNKAENDAALAYEAELSTRQSAINKLKALGLTDAEVSALTGK